MKTKAVIFDAGGVLIGLDFPGMFKRLTERSRVSEEAVRNLFWPEHGPEGESDGTPLARATAGRIGAEELLEILHREMQFDGTPVELCKIYHSIFTRRIEGTLEIMQKISHRLPVGVLSNTNALAWRGCAPLLPELELGKVFLSCEVQLVKPDPKLWQHLVAQFAVLPDELIFIDDTLGIVEGARKFGIDGIHFTSPEALSLELEKRALI